MESTDRLEGKDLDDALVALEITILATESSPPYHYVSYRPNSDTYIVVSSLGSVEFWDWQYDEDVWSDFERKTYWVRKANLSELREINKKFDLFRKLKDSPSVARNV